MENILKNKEEQVMQVNIDPIIMPVASANKIAQDYLNYIEEDELGNQEYRRDLQKLISNLTNAEEFSGDADDFHNFAVTLAKSKSNDLACKILEYGLKYFPNNVDLLADFLQFGQKCKSLGALEKYYAVLKRIPRVRWSWRGFEFSINYLMFLSEQNASEESEEIRLEREKEMLSIAEDYRKYYPYDEDSYIIESQIYLESRRNDDEILILQKGMSMLKACPRCCFRYADIMLNRANDYDEAMKAILRGLKELNQSQIRVKFGYFYYLSALCKIALYHQNPESFEVKKIKEIYCDMNIALGEFDEDSEEDLKYIEVIKSKANILINKTQVQIPDEYDKLQECLDE